MSLEPNQVRAIPGLTVLAARGAFPKGSLAIRIRDSFGRVWTDEEFAEAFSATGRPAVSPGALCLVSVLQHLEGLTDRQAAESVRARIDWKYALGLELSDPGFDFSVLSEFRLRLVEHDLGGRVLEAVLECCEAAGLLDKTGEVRTDSTTVLAGIRALNRLEFFGETVRSALEMVAQAAPEWLAGRISAERVKRYARPVDNWTLPKKSADRDKQLLVFVRDGYWLLDGIGKDRDAAGLGALPAVATLAAVWSQQCERQKGKVIVREMKDLPLSETVIISPYDTDARYSVKRGQSWTGYKVHLSETCEGDRPHLVVAVHTTHGAVPDLACTEPVAEQLRSRGMAPSTHFVDQGYIAAYHIVREAEAGTVLYGPIRGDWTTTKGSAVLFKASDFTIDREAKQAICPAGQTSTGWSERDKRGNGTVTANIHFPASACRPCPLRSRCTTSNITKNDRGRGLSVMIGAEGEALINRRQEQRTDAWKERYRRRAGIEGTIGQAAGRIGLRRSRYRGIDKTRLQHLLGAAAINFIRVDAWQCGYRPETTRTTHLARL